MLDDNPSLVDVQPAARWSALHQAAYADELQIVQSLLRFGASLDVCTSDGRSPIDLAGEQCKELLQATARCAPPCLTFARCANRRGGAFVGQGATPSLG